ncbi:MAG TPA: serine hydrolase domain-containing protein [Candidatus Limnocylindria bacterium]|nr:serine hydrolase domain-containing protein [Candidatus Limnocylindria bacterium]
MHRRHFIATTALTAIASTQGCVSKAPAAKKLSIVTAFDREMDAFMSARNIPGGALAVVKDRRLVYARGYGWANRERQLRATPDSLFRIASLSKPITGVAIMKLIEDGRLSLDTKALSLLNLHPLVVFIRDPEPRLRDITIRQLLQHTGGWDRAKSIDPMFRSAQIARAAHTTPPATPENVIRYMLGRELDFEPGARYAYSNFGYCVLGRVIEKVTGERYEQFVREHVLAPAGITRMRLGKTLDGQQAPGEVRYYQEAMANSVFPNTPEKVPWPYGGFALEPMDAHGGWIASAIDLARFAAALDDPLHSPLLKPDTFQIMYAPPPPPASRTANGSLEASYYGCGWSVRPVGQSGKANYWHNGSLPGTSSLLVRRADGLSWVALFNHRSDDKDLPDTAIDPALHRAAAAVDKWPKENLFVQ